MSVHTITDHDQRDKFNNREGHKFGSRVDALRFMTIVYDTTLWVSKWEGHVMTYLFMYNVFKTKDLRSWLMTLHTKYESS